MVGLGERWLVLGARNPTKKGTRCWLANPKKNLSLGSTWRMFRSFHSFSLRQKCFQQLIPTRGEVNKIKSKLGWYGWWIRTPRLGVSNASRKFYVRKTLIRFPQHWCVIASVMQHFICISGNSDVRWQSYLDFKLLFSNTTEKEKN